jgi:2-polyprenyl-3-methyl-5-hydroxy-6-metoxy-1,4-benzoquinol methylase
MNNDLKETYNKIAKDWVKDHDGDSWWVEGTDTFLSFLPKGATILDVGCAGGHKAKYIKDRGFNVEGIDFSEEMIKEAKKRFPEISFQVFDVYDIDKYPKTFDAIFTQAVLLHIPKKRIIEVLEKIKSRLNPEGILHISLKEVRDNKVEEEVRKENDYGYEYERFFSYYTLEELEGYFKNVGLELISEKTVNSGRSNWINIVGKK